MKTYIYALLAFLLISCSTISTITENKQDKKVLEGTWEVTTVKFTGGKTDLFDLADSECFKGSEWVFTSNNGLGKFTVLNTTHCENSIHKIQWSLFEPGNGISQFQFKYADAKNKPEGSGNKGYQSEMDWVGNNSMVMHIKIGRGNLMMTFNKISEKMSL